MRRSCQLDDCDPTRKREFYRAGKCSELPSCYRLPIKYGLRLPRYYRARAWSTVRRRWLRSRQWVTIEVEDLETKNRKGDSQTFSQVYHSGLPIQAQRSNHRHAVRKTKEDSKFQLRMLIMMIPSFAFMFYMQNKLTSGSNVVSGDGSNLPVDFALNLLTRGSHYGHHGNGFPVEAEEISTAREYYSDFDREEEKEETTEDRPSTADPIGEVGEESDGSVSSTNLSDRNSLEKEEAYSSDEDEDEDP